MAAEAIGLCRRQLIVAELSVIYVGSFYAVLPL